MAKTPEGAVKDDVKRALAAYGVYPFMDVAQGRVDDPVGAYYMPVAGPFAIHGIHDFVGCWSGRFWSIETKAPDNRTDETVHQGMFRTAITATGGIALTGVRDGAAAVKFLAEQITGPEN